jgi:hypothetical protein
MSDKKFDFKVNQNKNGYEIRTDILGLAQQLVLEEYKAKLAGWEFECKKEDGKVVTNVTMPDFPGLDKVLETAQNLYDFVNCPNKKDK